jgi:hypothetical protein
MLNFIEPKDAFGLRKGTLGRKKPDCGHDQWGKKPSKDQMPGGFLLPPGLRNICPDIHRIITLN